jgi:hypothetical protein
VDPRTAINRGQVWLRPFGHFRPDEQAYMGFHNAKFRDNFLRDVEDGALVLVWTKTKQGEKGWVSHFRGLLQIERRAIIASASSSSAGEALRKASDSDFFHAVPVCRAWEADPAHKVHMADIIPSMWPDHATKLGARSGLMSRSEVSNIEPLRIREVGVHGRPPITPPTHFAPISKVFL